MTCANRMGQATQHVSNLALGVCGALLICVAVMLIPSPGQAAAWFDAPAAAVAAR
ncbi:hypothetical protein [Brevundimonas sp.]|uniref:hypothetical protein n=1 Tax=Brevundimonas sp. TaxID=1871086 RepID=UPI00289AA8AD|nr:hypothetical protein [Brevundimonas sp.]